MRLESETRGDGISKRFEPNKPNNDTWILSSIVIVIRYEQQYDRFLQIGKQVVPPSACFISVVFELQ